MTDKSKFILNFSDPVGDHDEEQVARDVADAKMRERLGLEPHDDAATVLLKLQKNKPA